MSSSARPSLVWTRLHLPVTSTEQARAAIQALAGLSGQPRLVLEAHGQGGQVSWWLGADQLQTPRILRAMNPHLPGLRSDAPVPRRLQIDQAARVRLPGHGQTHHAQRGLVSSGSATDAVRRTQAVSRSLLGALAASHTRELVVIQVVLGPRYRPTTAGRESAAPALLGGLSDLLAGTSAHNARATRQPSAAQAARAEHRFGCELRIGADAATPERAHRLVDGVLGALRGLETPGIRVATRRLRGSTLQQARSPWLWALELPVSDVAAVLGWPIAEQTDALLPGVPAAHPRMLAATTAHPTTATAIPTTDTASTAILARTAPRIVGRVTTPSGQRLLGLPIGDSLRHLHLLGPTGVGKSTLMGSLALQDMAAGRGVVVIDPKGDLVTDLLARIPAHRRSDVVVLDATDPSPVGINGVGGHPGQATPGRSSAAADLAADTLLGVFHGLYADSWGPRTHDILHACLLTLARRGDGSLAMVPLLLTNPGFRRSVTGSVVRADPLGLGTFWAWYETISEAERSQAIAPLMNKLRQVLLRPGLRAVVGQRRPRFALSDVFTKRRILLVSLAKGQIGAEAARLLGSLTVSLLWQAALERIALPEAQRHAVMIHIDEVQDYLRLGSSSADVGDALAQARGLGIGFVLGHQHLQQLPLGLRDAVLANARSRITFGLSDHDARDLAAMTRGQLDRADFTSLPAYRAYASLLVAGSPTPWVSLATDPLPAPCSNPDALRAQSREAYGQPLDEVEADLLSLLDQPPATAHVSSQTKGTAQTARPAAATGIGRIARVQQTPPSGVSAAEPDAETGTGGQS